MNGVTLYKVKNTLGHKEEVRSGQRRLDRVSGIQPQTLSTRYDLTPTFSKNSKSKRAGPPPHPHPLARDRS